MLRSKSQGQTLPKYHKIEKILKLLFNTARHILQRDMRLFKVIKENFKTEEMCIYCMETLVTPNFNGLWSLFSVDTNKYYQFTE